MIVLSIPAYLRAAAEAAPDTTALALEDLETLTYREWAARANRFASGLRRHGVTANDRVALLYDGEDWLDFAVAYFGTLTAGATAVLLSARMTADEVRELTRRHSVALTVCGAAVSAPAEGQPVHVHRDLEAAGDDTPLPLVSTPDSVAEIIFTSATTGAAKGVAATHASMLYRGKQPDPAVLLHPLPVATTAAQLVLVDAVRGHQTLVLMTQFQPRTFCRLVERHRPVWVCLTPSMGAMLVRAREHRRHRLTSVRSVTFVSAPLQPNTLRQLNELFPEAVVRNYYSSTEASPAGVGTVFDPDRPQSVGRPEGDCSVRIVDDDGGDVPPGQTGEVLLRATDAAGRRYADDDEASAAVFRDGWVRTGDIGRLDDDGFLYLEGRKAQVINTGGFKVAALEVEQVLCEHPAVSEASVFGRPHPVLGEIVAAAVMVDGPVDTAELIRFCMQRLSRFKVPGSIHVVEDFPRNALGKPLKRELATRLAARSE